MAEKWREGRMEIELTITISMSKTDSRFDVEVMLGVSPKEGPQAIRQSVLSLGHLLESGYLDIFPYAPRWYMISS